MSTRAEFRRCILFTVIVSIALTVLVDLPSGTYDYEMDSGLIDGLFRLCVLIPSVAVYVRTLHGMNRSG